MEVTPSDFLDLKYPLFEFFSFIFVLLDSFSTSI